jgi:hypothetical protein
MIRVFYYLVYNNPVSDRLRFYKELDYPYGDHLTIYLNNCVSWARFYLLFNYKKRYQKWLQNVDFLASVSSMRRRMFFRAIRYAFNYIEYGLNKASRNEAKLTPFLFVITHLRKLNVFSSSQTHLFSYYNEYYKHDTEYLKAFPFVDKKLRRAKFNVLLGQIVNKSNKFHQNNTLVRQEVIS